MGSYIGFNINGANVDVGRAATLIQETKPRLQLVMDNNDLVKQTAHHTEVMICRYHYGQTYSEGDFWKVNPPHTIPQYIRDRWGAGSVPDNVYFDVCNEPSVGSGSPEEVKALLDWEIETHRACRAAGLKYATAHAIHHTMKHEHVTAGVWDDFLRELYQFRDTFFFGFHSYTHSPYLLAGQEGVDGIENPAPLGQWASLDMSGTTKNWHIGREAALIARGESIGSPIPRYGITEAFTDNMSDLGNRPYGGTTYKEWSRARYASAFYNGDLRGMMSWVNYTQDKWGVNPAQYVPHALNWLQANRHPKCVGISYFTLSRADDWHRAGFGLEWKFSETIPVIDAFRQWALENQSAPPPQQPPAGEYRRATVTVGPYNVKLRTSSGISQTNYTGQVLPAGTVLENTLVLATPVADDGYVWYAFSDGQWFASYRTDGFELVTVEFHEEPEMETTYTLTFTEEPSSLERDIIIGLTELLGGVFNEN